MKTALLSLLLIPTLVLLHLFAAPHTKVEESPAIQAAHDILVYGIPIPAPSRESVVATADRLRATYDHLTFSGVVPRSFVGPVVLAGIAQPALQLGAVDFAHAQLLVRAVLGLANAAALLVFARALRRAYGDGVGAWWVCFLAGQFHVFFYASRTLGNVFAFGLTTIAFSFLVPHPNHTRQPVRERRALALLSFASVVFRAELAILLGAVGLHLLVTRRTTASVLQLAMPVVTSSVIALLLSVPIDSYFWLRPIWPELWAFYYNAVLGNASNWGVEPWHYYFTSALPRLLLNPAAWGAMLPLAAVLPATKRGARDLLAPSLLFVAIYSLQPHKETRFVLYVVPPLTAAAALGANYVFARRTKSLMYALASLALVLSVLASVAASLAMLLLSSLNYPGGDALNQLFTIIARASDTNNRPVVAVHTDVLSCMTGVTLFGQNPSGLPVALYSPDMDIVTNGAAPTDPSGKLVLFDKTEDESVLRNLAFWNRFDYVLAEDPAVVLGQWDVVGEVHGYAGVELARPGPDATPDPEKDAPNLASTILGKGAVVARTKAVVRSLTGGWWVGPRMAPRIRILRRAPIQEGDM